MTPHVEAWNAFLSTVEVRGPIPVTFRVVESRDGMWILESTMSVPDREDPASMIPVIFQQTLPEPHDPTPKSDIIRARVLGMYQHEALESIYIGGDRTFDPHRDRWYSNIVADWRFNR